jgi:hypothetical protein
MLRLPAISIFTGLAMTAAITTASISNHSTDAGSGSNDPVLVSSANHVLGQVVGGTSSLEFYNQSLSLLVPVGTDGNVGESFAEYFTTTNCTGTGYYMVAAGQELPSPGAYVTLLTSVNGGYFKLQDTKPASLAMQTVQDVPNSCDATTNSGYAVPVVAITSLPFRAPIPLPVHLTYAP